MSATLPTALAAAKKTAAARARASPASAIRKRTQAARSILASSGLNGFAIRLVWHRIPSGPRDYDSSPISGNPTNQELAELAHFPQHQFLRNQSRAFRDSCVTGPGIFCARKEKKYPRAKLAEVTDAVKLVPTWEDSKPAVLTALESSFSDWYISFMGRRKSPQEKKQLEYAKDHFTFGWNSSRLFPRAWSRKKAHANRQYRHKSEELLGQAKPGIANDDVELIADDWTAEHFRQSVSRKRLYKHGTVTQGEKIKRKLEKRKKSMGQHVRQRRWYDDEASSPLNTLNSLKGMQLIDPLRSHLLQKITSAESLPECATKGTFH